jgi:hypothetical protein
MKFKINNHEMMALITFLLRDCTNARLLMLNGRKLSTAALLHLAIIEEMVIKLQQKALIKKDKYNIKMQPYQAICFWVDYNGKLPETTQLGNMVQTMCNAIHQQIISK